MKILHVIPDLSFSSGGASWVFATVPPLTSQGMNQAIAYVGLGPVDPARAEEIRRLQFKFYHLPFPARSPLAFAWQFKRLLKAERFDIVHCHTGWQGAPALFLALLTRVPVRIVYFHSGEWQHAGGPLRTLQTWFLTLIGRFSATHFWAGSKGALERWMGFGAVNDPRCRVLPGAVAFWEGPTVDAQVQRKALGLPSEALVVGHVGRMAPVKNHTALLLAFKEFLEEVPSAVLALAGDGPSRNSIEALTVRLGIRDKVFFLGLRKDIARCLQAMDIFIFPSLFESLGLAVIEAQDAGLPIVWSDVPGLREAVAPRWKAYGVDPRDPESICRKLLEIRSEPKFRPAEFLENFSQTIAATRLLGAYKEAIKTAGYYI